MKLKDKLYYKDELAYLDIDEGEVIFREGDYGEEMFFIIKGKVKVYLEKDGQEIVLNDLKEGEFFGEMSLLEGLKRSANVKATEKTTLQVIDKKAFRGLLDESPQRIRIILKGLSGRLRSGNERLNRLINVLDYIRRFYN